MTVDDRLRQAGGARAVEHPEGMIEGQLLERERHSFALGPQVAPGDGVTQARESRVGVEIAEHHRVLDGRKRCQQLLEDAGAVEVLAAVAIAVDRKEDARLDLREAVDHAPGAEVGGTARPDRTDRGAGEEGLDGLANVREIRGNAVSRADTESPQAAREPRHLVPELASSDLRKWSQLGGVPDRDRVHVARPQGVLGVVEARAGEPLRAWHRPRAEDPLVRRRGADVEAFPDRGPEALEVGRRPLPQARVVR